MFRSIMYVLLFCLAIQTLYAVGVAAKTRPTVEDADNLYFPGVAWSSNINAKLNTPNKMAGAATAAAVGLATRTLVVSQTPRTAVSHISALNVNISSDVQKEVKTIARKNRKLLSNQLRVIQHTIIAKSNTCSSHITVLHCVAIALTEAINKTPKPLKAVLEAIKNTTKTTKDLLFTLRGACSIAETYLRLPGICAAIDTFMFLPEQNNPQQRTSPTSMIQKQTLDEEQRNGECEKDVNINPSALDRLVVYDKKLTTLIETAIQNVHHEKTLVICVQRGQSIPQSFINSVANAFKEDIFPLVSRITGRVHPSPYIFIKIARFHESCTDFGFYCWEIKPNQIFIKLPDDLQLYHSTFSARYFSTIAHEYAHMIDSMTKKHFEHYHNNWKYRFLVEGFAEFVAIEYLILKNEIKNKYLYPERFLDKMTHILEKLIAGPPNNINNTFSCFLDAPEINFMLFNRSDQVSIVYTMGAIFMQYVQQKFDKKNPQGINIMNKNKSYDIFAILARNEDRINTLKQQAIGKLGQSWDHFCSGFNNYLINR